MTPNNIGEALKGLQHQSCTELVLLSYDKNQNVNLILDPIIIKSLPYVKKVLRYLIFQVSSKVTVLMHGN